MAVKMWSPKGNQDDGATHIGLTSGHTFVIPHDKTGIEVPLRFRKKAIEYGCLPVGMEEEDEDTGEGFDRVRTIRAGLNKMMDSTDEGMFTVSGKPVLVKLAKIIGFQPDRSEVNRVWNELEAGTKSEDDDDAPSTTAVGDAAPKAVKPPKGAAAPA